MGAVFYNEGLELAIRVLSLLETPLAISRCVSGTHDKKFSHLKIRIFPKYRELVNWYS